MTLKKAVEILEKHNKWRRYDGESDEIIKMADPKELGQAIDVIIENFNKCEFTDNENK